MIVDNDKMHDERPEPDTSDTGARALGVDSPTPGPEAAMTAEGAVGRITEELKAVIEALVYA